VHWNDDAFPIHRTIINGMTSALAIKDKTNRLRNSGRITSANGGKLAHAEIATSIGLIRISSTGGISL
jgi:hypothetical protein